MIYRWTFRRPGRPTARTRSVGSTPFTRSLSTRRVRTACLPRESVAMTGSSQDMVVRPSLFSTRKYYSLFLLILYWFAKQNYRIGFVWLAYNVSVIYHLASLQFIHLILCYWQFSDSYSVNSFRQKPPRRLCWSCSARAASTTPSVPSRFVHLLSRT
jgi:hypothetical protein